MHVFRLETENVAGQMESSDLTASVHQDFVRSHRPAYDLVEVFGGLVLAVDLGVSHKRHARTHELDRTGLRRTGRRHAMRLLCRLPLGNIPDRGPRQHGSSPQLMRPLVTCARGSENSDKIPPG